MDFGDGACPREQEPQVGVTDVRRPEPNTKASSWTKSGSAWVRAEGGRWEAKPGAGPARDVSPGALAADLKADLG